MTARPTSAEPATAAAERRPIRGGWCFVNPAVSVEAPGGAGPVDAAALVQTLLEDRGRAGRRLKADAGSEVWLCEAGGHRWIVKTYGVAGLKLRLYHGLRRSRAWREWRGAVRLDEAGVRSNRPLALACERSGGVWRESLVLPYVEGVGLAEWRRGTEDVQRRRRMARAIGRQMGRMTAAGLVNRDHKAANLIVDHEAAEGGRPPVMIDPAGVRRRRSEGQVCRMIARLRQTLQQRVEVSPLEQARCLRAMLEHDPTLAAGARHRFRAAALAVLSAQATLA